MMARITENVMEKPGRLSTDTKLSERERLEALIIDESIQPNSWLARRVRELGCRVKCVASVSQYLDERDTTRPDIVLVDTNVFDPDAVDNIVNLRAYFGAGKAPHIIAMTSFSPGHFDNMLKQAGCDLSVTKSCDLTKVLDSAKTIIKSRRRSRCS